MSLSILALVYDLSGAAAAASLARVLITPAAKLAYTLEDDELGKLKNYGSGIAFILGLFVIGTNNAVTGVPGTIGVGLVVPTLIGLYLVSKRAPELLRRWEQTCDTKSGEILDGIASGSYLQQVQPLVDKAKLQATELVQKYAPQKAISVDTSARNFEPAAEASISDGNLESPNDPQPETLVVLDSPVDSADGVRAGQGSGPVLRNNRTRVSANNDKKK